MKSIFKKVAGIAVAAVLALGMFSCSNDTNSHEHIFATTYSSDATHHWHAATCEHTTEVKNKVEHTFGEWKIITPSTEKSEGVKERECSDCHYKAEEKIAKLAHVHIFAAEWINDDTYHWHAATCEHTTEVKDKAEHSFSEWNDGKRSCSVCNYEQTCVHAFGEWKITTPPTEKTEGVKERECSECGYKATEIIAKLDHVHTFATVYTSDATHHWHAATCEHTTEVKDKAEHTFGEWKITTSPTEKTEGVKERECSVCGYKGTEKVAKFDHVHTFATVYTSDATHHWHAATCEHTTEVKDKAEHSFSEWNDGKRSCSVCNYEQTCVHTFGEWVSNGDATKEADGTKYRICSDCSYKETVTDVGSKLPDYSKCAVGDFILKNGTILSKDETPESGTVAAVIVRAAADGKPALGVGIEYNRSGLLWRTTDASGYNINVKGLQGDKTSGYMDGSDGWEKLKAAYSNAKSRPEYYPAWKYCLDYATKNNLTGDLANGWYLPTVAELYTIYQNKTVVDTSLSKAGGSQFGTSTYWSCCQDPSYSSNAQALYFGNGSMISYVKYNYKLYVCSVRAFN